MGIAPGITTVGKRASSFLTARGVAKTHLQHVAIAAAINIDRLVAWLDERPRAQTRTSRFAALAPPDVRNPEKGATSSPPAGLAAPLLSNLG
jgi:hypothetical protein